MADWFDLQVWWLARRRNMMRRKLHRYFERRMAGRA